MFAYTTWFDILSNAVKLMLLILLFHMHSKHWTSDLLGVNNYIIPACYLGEVRRF